MAFELVHFARALDVNAEPVFLKPAGDELRDVFRGPISARIDDQHAYVVAHLRSSLLLFSCIHGGRAIAARNRGVSHIGRGQRARRPACEASARLNEFPMHIFSSQTPWVRRSSSYGEYGALPGIGNL